MNNSVRAPSITQWTNRVRPWLGTGTRLGSFWSQKTWELTRRDSRDKGQIS